MARRLVLRLRPILLAGGLILAVIGCSPPDPGPPAPPPGLADRDFEARLLAVHNRERGRVGVPPLAWSDELARHAASYAPALADLGRLEHSSRSVRSGEGENLWMGTAGAYRPEHMAEGWASERRWFVPGRFPDVSSTGRWADVGHYTQMIWPGTRELGCAMARDGDWDFLVCRYRPAGNVIGRSLP